MVNKHVSKRMCIKTQACGEKEYHLFNNGPMVKDLAFKHGGERM